MKKTGLNGYVYDFSVDYDIDVILWCWWYIRHSQVLTEKKWYIIKCVGLLKSVFYNNAGFWL